jgi:hypothetical protein
VVWCLTGGIATVYLFLLLATAKLMPPTRAQLQVLGRRALGGVLTIAVMGACRFLPLVDWAQLAVAACLGAPVHLFVMSKILGGHPFSISGIKEMIKKI